MAMKPSAKDRPDNEASAEELQDETLESMNFEEVESARLPN